MKTCQPEALSFGPRDEMIAKGKKRVEFLKKKGFEKAELYGENEMGGLHVLQVCKHGHEAYGLPDQSRSPTRFARDDGYGHAHGDGCRRCRRWSRVSPLRSWPPRGYKPRRGHRSRRPRSSWTPEQRALADREVKELLEKEARNN